MEINLKFSSHEEMNKFCWQQVQWMESDTEEKEEIFYQDIEVLKYFHEMNVKLNNYQWNWLPAFFSNGSYFFEELKRQIGKTEFFVYLISYIIKKEQKKVLYVSHNTHMIMDFLHRLNNFSPLTPEENKLIRTTTKNNNDDFRGQTFDYIFYDEVSTNQYVKISQFRKPFQKEIFLSSI